jgi:capsular exopolysaccharide synthesis family protein
MGKIFDALEKMELKNDLKETANAEVKLAPDSENCKNPDQGPAHDGINKQPANAAARGSNTIRSSAKINKINRSDLNDLILSKINQIIEQKKDETKIQHRTDQQSKNGPESVYKNSNGKNSSNLQFPASAESKEAEVKVPAPVPKLTSNGINSIPGLAVTGRNAHLIEYFKTLKTQLLRSMKEKDCRTLVVTSVAPKEGKSFIAANLAASIALGLDEYVLFVEMDFRRPVIADRLRIQEKQGLSDFLSGEITDLAKIVKPSGLPKLSVITAGMKKESASLLLSSETMRQLMLHFRSRYDDRYIIIDAPPAHLAETISISEIADGTVIVLDSRKTGRRLLNKAIELLNKEKLIGTIMNNFRDDKTRRVYY